MIAGMIHKLKSGAGIVMHGGALQNLVNSKDKPMKLYTTYGPPNHVDQLAQKTKFLAQASSAHFDGKVAC